MNLADIALQNDRIAEYIREHEELSLKNISKELGGISVSRLSQIAREHGVCRRGTRIHYVMTKEIMAKLWDSTNKK